MKMIELELFLSLQLPSQPWTCLSCCGRYCIDNLFFLMHLHYRYIYFILTVYLLSATLSVLLPNLYLIVSLPFLLKALLHIPFNMITLYCLCLWFLDPCS